MLIFFRSWFSFSRLKYLVFAWLFIRFVRKKTASKVIRNASQHVNRTMPALLTYSATHLAELIRTKQVTSAHVVRLFIDQIKMVNPQTNAMVVFRFDRALELAEAADRAVQAQTASSSPLPPFHGVPMTVKECFETPGEPWTAGIVQRKNVLGVNNCTAVQRCEDAGFIVLGKGNLSEACMWMEAKNQLYGTTNNAYDFSRTVGGSSGGDACTVSFCGAPVCLSSDVGGSIRIPAFFNGLFGHKPTGASVPNTFTHPTTHNKVQRFCQLGPIARHAEDLMPLLRIVAGSDSYFKCEDYKWPDPSSVQIAGLTVLNIETISYGHFMVSRRDKALVQAHKRVVQALRDRGCRVVDVDWPEMYQAFDIWSAMMDNNKGAPFREIISEGKSQIWVLWEMLKLFFGCSDHTFPALGLALVERLTEAAPGKVAQLVAAGEKLKAKMSEEIGDGVLLYPSLPKSAPEHDFVFRTFDCSATCIFNVMELPATQVPLGLNEMGLPLGIQVVANHGQDHKSIAVAIALQEAFGGWQPPLPPDTK